MQIAFLRSFLGVARLGSVRKGAEDVNITPSAVSRHIAVLERVVGAPLFERRARGMLLTPEGEILRKHAMRMVSSFDVVKEAVDEIKGLRLGVVRIHAIEAVTSSVLNPAIREYVTERSGITFQVAVVIGDNNDVIHALLRDEADIGIMYKLNINADIGYLAEFPTPFAVIMSPSHPLASREQLSVRDLVGNPVAVLHPSTATRRLIEEALRANGVQLSYTLVVNSIEMAKEFARTSVGLTILPAISTRLEVRAGSLVAVPLSDWTLSRVRSTICTDKHRPLPKAAQDFLELLKTKLKAAT